MKSIILAGGSGTRLWPLSRSDFPKQFLSFDGKESLLRKAANRAGSVSDEVAVVTGKRFACQVQKELEDCIHPGQILIEPVMRNTAPAIALAIAFFLEKGASSSDLCLVMPSDHLISPEDHFFSDLQLGQKMARKGSIVTFGIHPLRPETGFGYLKKGKEIEKGAFCVERFIEKPTVQKAQEYLENEFLWNGGIYLFTLDTFLHAIEQFAPKIHSFMQRGYARMLSSFDEMPDISIDYALMEKAKDLIVVPLTAAWYDMGSWDQVYDFLAKDENENAFLGNVSGIGTRNCLVIAGKRLISTIGLEGFLVIETEDAILIAKRGESQKVKELVQTLEKKHDLA